MAKFHELSVPERHVQLEEEYWLTQTDLAALSSGGLTLEKADTLIENVIGLYSLPLALARNFLIDRKEYVIPMVTEEPSVVAGASKAAKMMRESGGITTQVDEPIATAQIQLIPKNSHALLDYDALITKHRDELINLGNRELTSLVGRGGGIRDISARPLFSTGRGPMLIVHVDIDTCDAMGANIASSVAEHLAPSLEKITDSHANLRILTNLTTKRLAKSTATIPAAQFSPETLDNLVWAQVMAEADPARAATHNKGIFNAIDAVALATGNDTRGIEAGGHAYAARSGTYQPLSSWTAHHDALTGSLELPLAVGTVGGLTNLHPIAKLSLELLGISRSKELASVMVAAGLAQNFAALLALATTGISQAHLPLHARRTP